MEQSLARFDMAEQLTEEWVAAGINTFMKNQHKKNPSKIIANSEAPKDEGKSWSKIWNTIRVGSSTRIQNFEFS